MTYRAQLEVALLPLVEMGTAPPSIPGYDMLRPVIPFSHWHVYSVKCSCLIELHSLTMVVIRLSCACKRIERVAYLSLHVNYRH